MLIEKKMVFSFEAVDIYIHDDGSIEIVSLDGDRIATITRDEWEEMYCSQIISD